MPPPPESRHTFPNLLNALFIIAALVGVEIVVAVIYMAIFGEFQPGDAAATGVVLVLANIVVFAGLMKHKRMSLPDLFHPGESSSRAVLMLLTLPIVLLFAGAAVLIDDLMAWVLVLLPMTQSQYDMFARLMSDGVTTFVVLCLVAPFFEEMLFRGVFLRSFLQQYSVNQAIVFSSALFGIAHMNIYQALTAFILGLALGWVYSRAQSLWPCIFGHAAFNLTGFLMSAPPSGSTTLPVASEVVLAPLPIQLAAIVCMAIGGYLLWKLLGGTQAVSQVRDTS